MRLLLQLIALAVYVHASSYIDHSEDYSLLRGKQKYYKELAVGMYKAEVYTLDELKEAFKKNAKSELAGLFHAVAYDEVGDIEQVDNGLKLITNPSAMFVKYPDAGLVLSDIYLRTGRFDEVINLLDKKVLLTLPENQKIAGYYYLGLSYFFKTGEINNDLKIAKSKFPQARRIYYKTKASTP